MRSSLPRPLRWRAPFILLSLLSLALAVRLPFLPATAHLGSYSDLWLWKEWSQQISQYGLAHIFDVSDINYIGYDYALWFIAVIYGRLSPTFDLESMRLHLLVKMPPIAFDLALLLLTYFVARRILRAHPAVIAAVRAWLPERSPLPAETALALIPAGIIALHPAIVYDSAAWGQTDSIISFFMLAAVAALARGAVGPAFFLWAVGFVVKPQPIVIVPPLVAFTWWVYGRQGLTKGALGATTGLGLMLGFWVAHGEAGRLLHVYHMLFTPEPTLSMQAWNVWWFANLHSHPVPGDLLVTAAGVDLTYKRASMLLFGGATLVALAYLRRRRDFLGLLEASAFMVFAFYMLPVSIHERYLYPLFVLLAPVLLVRPRWLLLYLPLSASFFLNLFVVAPLDNDLVGRWVDSEVTVAGAAFHVLAFSLLVAAFAYGAVRRPRLDRPPVWALIRQPPFGPVLLGDDRRPLHLGGRTFRRPLRLFEGAVDVVQRVLVRHQLVERVLAARAKQEVERLRDHPGIVHDDADDLLASPDQIRRVEEGTTAKADVADFQVGSTLPGHQDALGDHFRQSHKLAHHIAAPLTGEVQHPLHPRQRLWIFPNVDDLVRAEPPGQFQPRREPVDDDDPVSARLLRDRAGVQPEAAGSLDDDGVAEAETGLVEPERHL